MFWEYTIGYDSDNENKFHKNSTLHTIKSKFAFTLPLHDIYVFGFVLKSDSKVTFENLCNSLDIMNCSNPLSGVFDFVILHL